MSMQCPISDMVTRVKNAQMANFTEVSMPSSKIKLAIAKVLKDQGYVASYASDGAGVKPTLTIKLKYVNGKSVIEDIKRTSKPGLRIYRQQGNLPVVKGGLGIAIVSTSKGLMTSQQAKKQSLGGEVICTVS